MLIQLSPHNTAAVPQARLAQALRFLREADFTALVPGSVIPIDGEDVFAQVQAYDTQPADALRFETHEAYYDLQYLVAGREFIGCVARKSLIPATAYDAENDITFYYAPAAAGKLLLQPGDGLLISPETAHMPRCCVTAPESVHKIVIKIRA